MNRGIFSNDFLDAFDLALVDLIEDGFPSRTGEAPDPRNTIEVPDIPQSRPIDLPVDEFDFDLPVQAASAPLENVPSAQSYAPLPAVIGDFGPLLMGPPGGGGPGGGGGGGNGGGGGGKPGGGGNNNVLHDEWISGDLSGTSDPMNIEVELYGGADFWDSDLGLALEGYLQAASEFISGIITHGFADDPLMFHSYDTGTAIMVDDLLVEVYVEGFKGRNSNTIAAETEIFAANEFNGSGLPETPAGATITFNLNMMSDLESLGVLDDTVLHEMLHTLGFGLWETADNDLTSPSGSQIVYTGAGAAGNIVENEGLVGSVGGHWAEAVNDKELMTSIVETTDDMFLANYSIATLADLAVVNHDGSTGYQLAADWQAQIDDLNNAAEVGIDLDAWFLA